MKPLKRPPADKSQNAGTRPDDGSEPPLEPITCGYGLPRIDPMEHDGAHPMVDQGMSSRVDHSRTGR